MRGLEQIPWLYDGLMAVTDRLGLTRWRRRLVAQAEGRTLELGCGTGRNLPLYAAGTDLVAMDPDLRVILAARKRSPATPLVVADAQALPFRTDTFERVVSSLVFCSVPDPGLGFSEVDRVLGCQGRFALIEHVRHEGALRGGLQDFLQPAWTRLSGGCHINRRTEDTLSAAGFTVEPATRRARKTMRFLVTSRRGEEWWSPEALEPPVVEAESGPYDNEEGAPEDQEVVMEIGDVLDLHSFPPKQIKDLVRDYLDHAVEQGWSQVRIIHGKGIGVQRKTVRALLDKDSRVVSYGDPPGESGGWGATWVRLQESDDATDSGGSA